LREPEKSEPNNDQEKAIPPGQADAFAAGWDAALELAQWSGVASCWSAYDTWRTTQIAPPEPSPTCRVCGTVREDDDQSRYAPASAIAPENPTHASKSEVDRDKKKLRLFGPSNEPEDADTCIGDVDDLAASAVWETLQQYLPQMDESEQLVFRVKMMSDAEVDALPDV